MGKVRVSPFNVSLDGFSAGPNQSIDNPLGENARVIFQWQMATRMFNEMIEQNGGESNADDKILREARQNIGAEVMGRNKFGPIRGEWPDESWRGWWSEDKPVFDYPVFVLTHYPRPSFEVKNGATSFTFVTEGIEAALKMARDAAGDKDVLIGGGPQTVRQYLAAGLVDELHLVVTPTFLGRGEPLFDSDLDLSGQFESTRTVTTDSVTHYFFTHRGQSADL